MRVIVRNRDAPRKRVLDRAALPELETVGVFKSEQLGPKRSMTPQGYMLCEDVPIARTGTMYYANGEVPVPDGPGGFIKITRDEDELFKPEALASFLAMPVTDEHPEDGDVSPETWQERSHGFVLNVRRGEGENQDCIVCDLMITTREMVDAINSGKREVSAGYDAGYVPVSPGRGMQVNIMGNHVALVEQGRCGPRCAIGDSATVNEGHANMPIPTKPAPATRRRVAASNPALLRRILDAAEEGIKEALEGSDDEVNGARASGQDEPGRMAQAGDEEGGNHTHIHIHGLGGEGSGGNRAQTLDEPEEEGMAPATAKPGVPGGKPPGGDPAPSQAGGPATVEDRLVALETGMNQMLAFLKSKLEAAPAGPAGGAPAAEDPPNGAPANAPESTTEDSMPDGDDEAEMDAPGASQSTTMDSASLQGAHEKTRAMAEILMPGFAFPAFDKAAPRQKTMDSICGARRRVLDMAYSTTAGREVIDAVRGSTKTLDIAKLPCAQCGNLFRAAAGAMRIAKTRDAVGNVSHASNKPATPQPGTAAYIEKMNADARAFWQARAPVVTK